MSSVVFVLIIVFYFYFMFEVLLLFCVFDFLCVFLVYLLFFPQLTGAKAAFKCYCQTSSEVSVCSWIYSFLAESIFLSQISFVEKDKRLVYLKD